MTAKIKLNAASGGGSVSLKAPSTTTSNAAVELQLPVADGSADTFLKTDGSGNLAFAAAGGGKILQVVSTTKTNQFSQSIAQGATGGDITGLTVSITPSNASNKIFLTCTFALGGPVSGFNFYKAGSVISDIIGDADGSKKRVFSMYDSGSYEMKANTFTFLDTAGGTSAITYSVRVTNLSASYGTTIYVNSHPTARSGIGGIDAVGASIITAMEVAA